MARELLSYRLNTIHNLHYILDLMAGLRRAIALDKYQAFAQEFASRLNEDDDPEEAYTEGGNHV
jgi:queuine tRNA-ribosyltransferase